MRLEKKLKYFVANDFFAGTSRGLNQSNYIAEPFSVGNSELSRRLTALILMNRNLIISFPKRLHPQY